MIGTFFGWLRTAAREAVLAGVADAGKALAPEGDEPPDLAELRARLAAALAPPVKALPSGEDDAKPRKGKAVAS